MEDLEAGEKEYELVKEFLESIKREFGGGKEKSVKVAELKRIKQGGKKMEEFVQEFKRVARGNRYKGYLLIEKFKRGINRSIRRKLMEAKTQPGTIEQWCDRAIALDRNQRKSRQEEKRLREKKEKRTLTYWYQAPIN